MKASASTPRANASPSSLEVSEVPCGAAAERIERVELREQLRRVVDRLVVVPRSFAQPLGKEIKVDRFAHRFFDDRAEADQLFLRLRQQVAICLCRTVVLGVTTASRQLLL